MEGYSLLGILGLLVPLIGVFITLWFTNQRFREQVKTLVYKSELRKAYKTNSLRFDIKINDLINTNIDIIINNKIETHDDIPYETMIPFIDCEKVAITHGHYTVNNQEIIILPEIKNDRKTLRKIAKFDFKGVFSNPDESSVDLETKISCVYRKYEVEKGTDDKIGRMSIYFYFSDESIKSVDFDFEISYNICKNMTMYKVLHSDEWLMMDQISKDNGHKYRYKTSIDNSIKFICAEVFLKN